MKQNGAFIIGDRSTHTTALFDICRDLNFGFLGPYTGLPMVKQQIEQTPVCFFLCAETTSPIVLSPLLNELRNCKRRRIQFAPIVYHCESPLAETITLCGALGFDDVLTMPFTPVRMRARLERLITQPQTYFQASEYLGPHRLSNSQNRMRVTEATASYTHQYDFKRDNTHGVTLLREKILTGSAPVQNAAA